MSFYLAHPATQNMSLTVSASVSDRGLSLLRAKPCDVQISVLPIYNQPGYASYVKNLPAFMEATLENRSILISNRGYPVKTVPSLLPWKLPGLIYDFTKTPSDTKVEELKTHSTVVRGRGKAMSFVMTAPTLDSIKTLVNKEKPEVKTAHVIGTVNLDAMKVVFILQKVLSAFLLTHYYPAFRHLNDVAPWNADVTGVVSKKRKVSGTAFVACVSDLGAHVEDLDSIDESMSLTNNDATNIQLSVAKPTQSNDKRWGNVNDLPNTSGMYVPFVRDLAIGDTITVPNLLSMVFIRSLASSIPGMFATLDTIRSAWGVISTTDLGHEITHLCKCIDIALQAQACVFPIYTGDIYEGCAICGAGYSINLRNEVYEPIPYVELQKVVQDGSAHAKSVRGIIAVVDSQDSNLIPECKTMRQLANVLQSVELDAIERKKVVDFAHHLCYSNKYWSTAATNVSHALDLLSDPESEIPDDVPMHPKYMFSDNRVEQVMSAFGHQAPTFMIPNGKRCELADKEPPKNFHVRTLATDMAIADMKYVMENGYITNNLQNLSSKHRDAPLKGTDKTDMWAKLGRLFSMQQGKGFVIDRKPSAIPDGEGISEGLW